MNIILKIARAELRSLFYSPVAWIVAVAFFVASGVKFVLGISLFAVVQENMQAVAPHWPGFEQSLTGTVFQFLYETLTAYLYLFIPLLTMGVINKELTAGTIKLLYSAPVKSTHIVLGKFAGLMAFLSLLILLVALLMTGGAISIEHVDVNMLLSGLLGYYLLTAAYASMGLFISALTSYQIVAGVATFMLFFLLHVIGRLWQQYDLVRDLTWFLSITGRVDNFLSGLITSRDILYFLIVISMFIGFTLIKLRSIHDRGGWQINLGRYCAVFAAALLLGYLSSRPGYILYADVSRHQQNTIHPVTQGVVDEMEDEPLTVTLYANLFDPLIGFALPQARNNYIWEFWEKYVRFHPNMKFRYVYYYDLKTEDSAQFMERFPGKSIDEIAEELCVANDISASLFKKPQEIRKLIDLAPEDKRLVMQLEYKGKKVWLRTFLGRQDPWPLEMNVSAAVRELVRDSMPRLIFTSGHFERSPFKTGEKEYYGFTLGKLNEYALLNEGVFTDTVNLAAQDIPEDASILAVADPKTAYTDIEVQKIKAFIAQGGNVVFFGEPGKQPLLNPILNSIGVNLDPGIIVRTTPNEMPQILVPPLTDSGGRLAAEPFLYQFQHDPQKRPAVKMDGSTVISYDRSHGFDIHPVLDLAGDDTTWVENGRLVKDSAAPVFMPSEGDIRLSNYVTSIRLSRRINNKEQRIVVSGDADYMSSLRGRGGALGNAAFSWLLYNEYPKYTNRPWPLDTKMRIGENSSTTFYITYLFVLPGIMLITGILVLLRRNRK